MSDKRFEPGEVGQPAALQIGGDRRDPFAQGARLRQVGLEVLGEPLVEPERQIAVSAAKQGVGRLVSQVFRELRARVSVDDSLASLCQEEGSPLRQLGIVELQKVDERVSIVEHVDFDRIVVGLRVKIEVLRQVALECLQAIESPAGRPSTGNSRTG